MPQKYLRQVHSHPIRVPLSTWTQWYTEEHLRDMVFFGITKTSALYKSTSHVIRSPQNESADLALMRVPSATMPDSNDYKSFLALYQADREHPSDSEKYDGNVRLTSELWDRASSIYDVGSFRAVDLEIVGNYPGAGGAGATEDEPPTHIIHSKLTGPRVEHFRRQCLIDAAAQLDGYQRTLVYWPITSKAIDAHMPRLEANGGDGIEDAVDAPADDPYVYLIHEYGAVGHGKGLERIMGAFVESEGGEGLGFLVRAYELVGFEGFGGRCRRPERLGER